MATVPRLSKQRRALPLGSPTALVQKQIIHDKRGDHCNVDASNVSLGTSNLFVAADTSLVSTSDDCGDTMLAEIAHVERLRELRRQKHLANRITREKLLASTPPGLERTSWDAPTSMQCARVRKLLLSCFLLQRVGRGYLLRSCCHPTNPTVVGSRKVSQRCTSDNVLPEAVVRSRAQKLLNTYELEHLRPDEIDQLLHVAKNEQRQQQIKLFRRLSGSESSRALLSSSTLFLSKADVSVQKKMTAREVIRQQLMAVDFQLKQRVEQLDRHAREAQRKQEMKMLDLAREESEKKERHRQAMAKSREYWRIVALEHRKEEHARELEARLQLKSLHREFEIKRAELHVELRQRYMCEDRVTALRNTFAELGNITHLSASVPSLNLTLAMKEAHFHAEGLTTGRTSHGDCDP